MYMTITGVDGVTMAVSWSSTWVAVMSAYKNIRYKELLEKVVLVVRRQRNLSNLKTSNKCSMDSDHDLPIS